MAGVTTPDRGDPIPEPCRKCGQPHYRVHQGVGYVTCRGHNRRGAPCMKFPIHGAAVCKLHGGGAPQVQAAAVERLEAMAAQQRLARDLTSAGEALPYEDPIANLLWLVSMTKRAVVWWSFRVAELETPDPQAGDFAAGLVGVDDDGEAVVVQPAGRLYGPSTSGGIAMHPVLKEWQRAMDQNARFAKMAVDAGVSERMVRIAEAQGETIAQVVEGTLNELGLSPAVRDEARRIISVKFTELSQTNTDVQRTA